MNTLNILIPVYNDWDSLELLISKIESIDYSGKINLIKYTIVNDGSSDLMPEDKLKGKNIEIIELNRNLGHQKALAVGLSYLSVNSNARYVLVMDSDGEDKPEHISKLFDMAESNPHHIIFAKRGKRQDGLFITMLYDLYKFFFGLITGNSISFGNYSIVPIEILKKLVHYEEIWTHYSAGVMKSKFKFISIVLEKGKRYKGKSKMNLYSLVLHGLSSFAVYLNLAAVRILILAFVLILLATTGIAVILFIKLFTNFATPGWATSAILGILIIIIQSFLTALLLVFLFFLENSQKRIIPILDYERYIMKVLDLK
jgi:polyisoprenyl-phosphate glycosyltransferase